MREVCKLIATWTRTERSRTRWPILDVLCSHIFKSMFPVQAFHEAILKSKVLRVTEYCTALLEIIVILEISDVNSYSRVVKAI